jgi:hypothetical protein
MFDRQAVREVIVQAFTFHISVYSCYFLFVRLRFNKIVCNTTSPISILLIKKQTLLTEPKNIIANYFIINIFSNTVSKAVTSLVYIHGCIHKLLDWPPGVKTANGTALCH